MIILAFESSCDETAASVVRDGREVLSSVIASSADMHAIYGGVVPEIASRKHVEAISGLADEALRQAGITKQDIDAVAVTYAPGLIGALLVGVCITTPLPSRATSDTNDFSSAITSAFSATSRRFIEKMSHFVSRVSE